MAVTSLLIPNEELGRDIKTQTVTVPHHGGLIEVIQYHCNDNWIPVSVLASIHKGDITEEQIHKEIREEAIKKGHFVESESTNPEYHGAGEEE